MELLGKDIESFEHYKSLTKEYSENESFRQELIDAFVDGVLLSMVQSWDTPEAKQYADSLSKIEFTELTDSELYTSIVDFCEVSVPAQDFREYFTIRQFEVFYQEKEVVFSVKIIRRAVENVNLSIIYIADDGSKLQSESVKIPLNITPNTEKYFKIKIPSCKPSLVRVEFYYNNYLLSSRDISKDITFSVKGVSFKMIAVDEGIFIMGATKGHDSLQDPKERQKVQLSKYFIGETQVTCALWKAVIGTLPCCCKSDNHPVTNVSWTDCQGFISKLNEILSSQLGEKSFSLPTESQWEYAARGGNKSKGYKFSGSNNIGKVAWYNANSAYMTHPVAQKCPNELGIYDMSGNISEWCQDNYVPYSINKELMNPIGVSNGNGKRARRGGCCHNPAYDCCVSARHKNAESFSFEYLGLRLVLNYQPSRK